MQFVKAVKAFWNTLLPRKEETKQMVITATKPVEMTSTGTGITIDGTKTVDRKAAAKSGREQFEAGAIYTLVLLQREGRLIDFLLENIDNYEDSQIGAAVRRIHQSCGKSLEDHFKIKRIIDAREGASFKVDAKADRAKIRMVGNVPDMLPFEGFVQHSGWEAVKIELPERNDGVDSKVIYPAEVGF